MKFELDLSPRNDFYELDLAVTDSYIIESIKSATGTTIGGEVLDLVKEHLVLNGYLTPSERDCVSTYVEYLHLKNLDSERISDKVLEYVTSLFVDVKSIELAENGADREACYSLSDHTEDVPFNDMLEYLIEQGAM